MDSVIEFMKKNAVFHSVMTYNCDRKSFRLDSYDNTNQGVYFILYEEDILKIGKADGQEGLKGRLKTYRSRLVKNFENGDSTVALWNRVMTGVLNGRVLSIYVLPIEPEKKLFHGIKVELSIVRSLELELSKLAKQQGHSLQLSGQN
ncbi:hypothetical protein N9L54_05915 [Porticoccaceae bacterium]|nr:hypothetical protein [Porticoccaceae bacterium]